ncbi:hypothetical protein [Acetobacter persici]|uniref:hypothetical protein n=1 Tax=Acetobacter persici TaxID=1076596 RepID=UPI0039E96E07
MKTIFGPKGPENKLGYFDCRSPAYMFASAIGKMMALFGLAEHRPEELFRPPDALFDDRGDQYIYTDVLRIVSFHSEIFSLGISNSSHTS